MEGFGLIWVEKVSGVFVVSNNTENMKNKKVFHSYKTRSFEVRNFLSHKVQDKRTS